MKRPKLNTAVLGYSLVLTTAGMLASLALQVGTGAAPIPPEWGWTIPILVQGLVGLTMGMRAMVPDSAGLDPKAAAAIAELLEHARTLPRGNPGA